MIVAAPNFTQDASEQEIREEVNRILQSKPFVASHRICRFLQYIVDCVFNGTADQLKGSWIADAVYDRSDSFDPAGNSIVRTEARRLRDKLKEYYSFFDKEDSVIVELPLGSYIPTFRKKAGSQAAISKYVVPETEERLATDRLDVSIAVVPFVAAADHSRSADFARTLTDELTYGFMHTEGVRVAAVKQALAFEAIEANLRFLTDRLGAHLIVEGTVREENNRLRVIVSLVDAHGFQIWSQRFEADVIPNGLFRVAEQMCASIINRTHLEAAPHRRQNLSIRNEVLADLPEIYSAELLIDKGAADGIRTALAKFTDVAARQPNLARPFCGLVQCYYLLAMNGEVGPRHLSHLALEAATRAVKIDPELSDTQTSVGCAQIMDWAWKEAEDSFKRAISLGNHVPAYRYYGLLLTAKKQFDRAFNCLLKAQSLDPFSEDQQCAMMTFFWLSRWYDKATSYLAEQESHGPITAKARLYTALVHLQCDRVDAAQELAMTVQAEIGAHVTLVAFATEIVARCGAIEQARGIAEHHQLFSPKVPISFFRRALLACAFGEDDDALQHLATSCAQKEPEMLWLATDPRFDHVRHHDMFRKTMNKMNRFHEA